MVMSDKLQGVNAYPDLEVEEVREALRYVVVKPESHSVRVAQRRDAGTPCRLPANGTTSVPA